MKYTDKSLVLKYILEELDENGEKLFEDSIIEDEDSLKDYIAYLETSIKEKEYTSKDFTDKVMGLVEEEFNREKLIKKTKKKNSKVNLFIYYTAAATITIIFSLSGVFDVISNNMGNKVYASDKRHEYKKVIKEGWTDRLASNTSAIINSVIYGKEE